MRPERFPIPLLAVTAGMMTALNAVAFEVTEIIPQNRTEVTSLSTIILKLDKPLGEWHPDTETFTINNAPLTYEAVAHITDFSEEITITVEPELNIPGTYEIVIPTGSLWDEDFEYLPEVRLIYQVENGSVSPSDIVKYDLTYTSITPEAGKADGSISNITLEFDREIFVLPETDGKDVRGRVYNEYDMPVANGILEKTAGNTVTVRLNNTVSDKARYTFVIEKGLIGDAEWEADNSKGHANKEIRVEYSIVPSTVIAITEASRCTVSTRPGTIIIDGMSAGSPVELHSVSGTKVYTAIAGSANMTVTTPTPGAYVLRIGDNTYKVIVK